MVFITSGSKQKQACCRLNYLLNDVKINQEKNISVDYEYTRNGQLFGCVSFVTNCFNFLKFLNQPINTITMW